MPRQRFKNEAAFSSFLRKELKKMYPDMLITNVTGTGYGQAGVHDLLICHCGVFISVELKQEGKKLTPLQETYAEQVTKAGGWSIAPLEPSRINDFFDLLDIIYDTARKNKNVGRESFRDSVDAMENADQALALAGKDLPLEVTKFCEACGTDTVHVPNTEGGHNCAPCAAVALNEEVSTMAFEDEFDARSEEVTGHGTG